MCLDARRLNKILIPRHDVPAHIDEVIRKFRGKTWLSSMDITSGYFNVKLSKDSRKYTAFSVNGIQYCYNVLPFGLRISGQMFIKSLESILSDEVKKHVAVYGDDIVIGSENLNYHLTHLGILFEEKAGIKLK